MYQNLSILKLALVAAGAIWGMSACTKNNSPKSQNQDTNTVVTTSTDPILTGTDNLNDTSLDTASGTLPDTDSADSTVVDILSTDDTLQDTANDTVSDTGTDTLSVFDTNTSIDTVTDTATIGDTDRDTATDTAPPVDTSTEWNDWIFGDYSKCTDSGDDTDSDTFDVCEAVEMEFERILTRAVILLDKSGSMGSGSYDTDSELVTNWDLATNAVRNIVTNYDSDVSFGLDVFPREPYDIMDTILMDIAPANGSAILSELDNLSAGGGTPLLESIRQYVRQYTYYTQDVDTDTITSIDTNPFAGTDPFADTSLHSDTNTATDTDSDSDTAIDTSSDQCQYACTTICQSLTGVSVNGTCEAAGAECCNLRPTTVTLPDDYAWHKYAPNFMDGQGESYLIVISDGEDYSATPEILGEYARILLEQYGIKSIAIGFGNGASEEQLNAIASNGGTSFTEFLKAEDGAALNAALNSIAEVVAVSCDFELGTLNQDDVNLERVIITFDGETIPRSDSACASGVGWMWKDTSQTTIQLCDQACNDLQNGSVENMEIQIACSDDDIVVE